MNSRKIYPADDGSMGDWLNGEEFREMCLDYRGSQAKWESDAFERLKEAILYRADLHCLRALSGGGN